MSNYLNGRFGNLKKVVLGLTSGVGRPTVKVIPNSTRYPCGGSQDSDVRIDYSIEVECDGKSIGSGPTFYDTYCGLDRNDVRTIVEEKMMELNGLVGVVGELDASLSGTVLSVKKK